MADAFKNGLNAVGGAVGAVGDSLRTWFTDLDTNLTNWFNDLIDNIGSLVDWINPLSDKFFLKVAFVPDSAFMADYSQRWDGLLRTKLGFFFQLKDTFEAINESVKSKVTTWDGIKIDISRWSSAGQVEIVSGYAMQQYGEKLRFWIGGLMYFLCGAWLIRKLSKLVGEGR